MFCLFACLSVSNKHKPLDGKAVKVCMVIQQATLHLQLSTGDGLDLSALIKLNVTAETRQNMN